MVWNPWEAAGETCPSPALRFIAAVVITWVIVQLLAGAYLLYKRRRERLAAAASKVE